ncbi:MAG: hypothetical protein ABIA59_01620 [Candidatus Latescibacterota bacterium]
MYAAGSGLLKLIDPSYTMRMIYLSGAIVSELDYILFESTVPDDNRSWGAIKNIYRK